MLVSNQSTVFQILLRSFIDSPPTIFKPQRRHVCSGEGPSLLLPTFCEHFDTHKGTVKYWMGESGAGVRTTSLSASWAAQPSTYASSLNHHPLPSLHPPPILLPFELLSQLRIMCVVWFLLESRRNIWSPEGGRSRLPLQSQTARSL